MPRVRQFTRITGFNGLSGDHCNGGAVTRSCDSLGATDPQKRLQKREFLESPRRDCPEAGLPKSYTRKFCPVAARCQ